MSEFWLYVKLGFNHVLDWSAYDHILFLTVLAVSFSLDQFKKILIVVSAFTLGHTIALFLAVYNVVSVNKSLVEFLIPVTIILTSVYTLFQPDRMQKNAVSPVFTGFTIFFGLIHGLGFSNYFAMISSNTGDKLVPALSFAVGVELSQLVLVSVVLLLGFIAQQFFRVQKRDWILIIAAMIIGLAIPMVQNNWIF